MPSDRTLGEIGRALDAVTTRLEALATQFDLLYLRKETYLADAKLNDNEHVALEGRIEKLESRSEWIVRTVGAIIIAAILATILISTHSGGGTAGVTH